MPLAFRCFISVGESTTQARREPRLNAWEEQSERLGCRCSAADPENTSHESPSGTSVPPTVRGPPSAASSQGWRGGPGSAEGTSHMSRFQGPGLQKKWWGRVAGPLMPPCHLLSWEGPRAEVLFFATSPAKVHAPGSSTRLSWVWSSFPPLPNSRPMSEGWCLSLGSRSQRARPTSPVGTLPHSLPVGAHPSLCPGAREPVQQLQQLMGPGLPCSHPLAAG